MGRRGKNFRKRVTAQRVAGRISTSGAGGDDNEVQFNTTGSLAGSSNLTFKGSGLAVNMSGSNPTHGITLPDSSTVEGQIKANAFVSYSSIRFKKDVQKLENAMDIITQLEGVSYKWKDTEKQDYGFIAEEVGRILPDIVEWEDDENATSIDYIKIISFLVEAVKYQHHQLNDLTEKVNNGSE